MGASYPSPRNPLKTPQRLIRSTLKVLIIRSCRNKKRGTDFSAPLSKYFPLLSSYRGQCAWRFINANWTITGRVTVRSISLPPDGRDSYSSTIFKNMICSCHVVLLQFVVCTRGSLGELLQQIIIPVTPL